MAAPEASDDEGLAGPDRHGAHRLIGVGLALLGVALLLAEAVLLYGSEADRELMARLGLPGVGLMSAAGAIFFAGGCLLAAAPRTVLDQVRRIPRVHGRWRD